MPKYLWQVNIYYTIIMQHVKFTSYACLDLQMQVLSSTTHQSFVGSSASTWCVFKLRIHQIYMVDPYLIVLKRNPIQAYDRKGQDGGRFLWLLTHFDITIRRRGKHILSFSLLVAHSGSLTWPAYCPGTRLR